MPHRYARKKWIRFKRIIKKLARSHSSSHDLAFGAAIGLFIGMQPIMGIQMLVAAAIAAICRVSKLAAIIPVWISNPFTFIPLYGFNYWVGHVITGLGPTKEEYHKVIKEVHHLLQNSRVEGESGVREFVDVLVEGTKLFGSMGMDAVISLAVGSVLLGAILAAVSYPISIRLIGILRRRRARKRNARHERVSRVIRESERIIREKK